MKYPTVFHLISEVFDKKDISSVLIGGFAVNYYKVTRQTADIDFLIAKSDYEKISDLLKKEGYKEGYRQEVFARLEGNKLYLMDLDFMFVDRKTLDRIIREGKEISIARQKFTIPSLEHLIALKLHAIKYNPKRREYTDLPDIIGLIKINKLNIRTDEFRSLCLKYGTGELYNKILERA